MKVVLFATRTVGKLAPISEFSSLALLTAACKPLIIHTVEALAMASLTDVIVVVSPDAYAVESALGDGLRWGMQFEYVLATSRESDEGTVQRIRHKLGEEYLLVRGEMLRTPIIAEFVERARALTVQSVIATIGGVEAGIMLVRRGSGPEKARAEVDADTAPSDAAQYAIEFPEGRLAILDSFADFHRAHLDALAGHFKGLIIPGREAAPGIKVGRHTKIATTTINQAPVMIGSRCRIAASAQLGGDVVVGDEVVIDRGAMLRSAVVMPHTYIGELVAIDNAIVAGNRLIHVDTGAIATIADSFLLATFHPRDVAARLRNFADRIAGLMLLIATIWLWPIGLLAAMADNPRRPIRTRILVGNGMQGKSAEFRAFEFSVSSPALRYLPYLLAVAAGHLRLVGVEALEAGLAHARAEEWEMTRDQGYVGLLGPVQLTASRDTPEEQRRIIEARYAATRSLTEDGKWMLRALAALVSSRAWHSERPRAIPAVKQRAATATQTTLRTPLTE
jgi:NDP-sugar pyrophosphorylase family protein